MKIKTANPFDESDLRVLINLHKACLPSDYFPNFKTAYWWVMYDKDKPIAFCGLSSVTSWPQAGYLCRSGVIDEYQGRGLQKKLIRLRERKARKIGWEWLISDTTNNLPSSNSLISCGYKLYEPQVKWAYGHSLYWRKRL